MPSLSQLVLLSVSAAVTVNFENSVQDRINWLEGVLSVLNPKVSYHLDPRFELVDLTQYSIPRLPKYVNVSWPLWYSASSSHTCVLRRGIRMNQLLGRSPHWLKRREIWEISTRTVSHLTTSPCFFS